MQTPTPEAEVLALEAGFSSVDPPSQNVDLGFAQRGALVATPGAGVNPELRFPPIGRMPRRYSQVERGRSPPRLVDRRLSPHAPSEVDYHQRGRNELRRGSE